MSTPRARRFRFSLLLTGMAFLAVGCIYSTKTERVQLEPTTSEIFTADSCGAFRLRLDDHTGWARRSDDAQIDEVGFACVVANPGPLPLTAEIWITPDAVPASSGAEVAARGFRVVGGVAVSDSSDARITYLASQRLAENSTDLRNAARNGTFYAYVLGVEPGYRLIARDFSFVALVTSGR